MKYGFIGGGNMGGAMAAAVIAAHGNDSVLLVDRDEQTTAKLAQKIGATASTYEQIAAECRLVFIAVKPYLGRTALEQLRPALQAREDAVCVVSIAAGVTIADMQEVLGEGVSLIRMMQNTPVAVGEGMLVYALSPSADRSDAEALESALSCAGRITPLEEKLIDAATAVMGGGPAFAYMFVEALADGGVTCGLSRRDAQLYAAQMLLGAAKMVLETGEHPGALKDAVCSPGGSTIAGVRALEESAFRGAVIDAVIDSYHRTQELK